MLALNCLNDCLANHEICDKPRRSRLPTRVIDCAVPAQPRLVSSEVLEDPWAPYITLSYVWGKGSSHVTTQANLETYKVSIELDRIPQTIQDAITVTHSLGMRFLWVDAFCIVQDSPEDKTKELVNMGNIYRDAYFTIIASSASEGRSGFLQDRVLPPHTRLPFYSRDGRLGTVCIGKRSETLPDSSAGREPVDRRAWCLQEWLLSPRKLLFTSDTLRYHCQTVARPVENSLRTIRTVQSFTLDHAFLPLDRAALANPALVALSAEERFARQCALWGLVVANYTQRLLSWETDKLVAFAAVAEQFDRIWEYPTRSGRYIAGCREGFLPRDLLWQGQPRPRDWDTDALSARAKEYIVPSWTWASVQGHVVVQTGVAYPAGECIRDICDVVECGVDLMDQRLPYGRVTGGYLKAHAVIAPAWFMVKPPGGPTSQSDDDNYHRLFLPTEKLRSQMCLDASSIDQIITAGNITFEGSPIATPITVPSSLTHEGVRLLAISRGRLAEDSTLLQRVGHCEIYPDSTECVAAENSWLMLVNRGDPLGRVTAEGLLVTKAGAVDPIAFRRLGSFSMTVELSSEVRPDSIPWLVPDAVTRVITLV